MIFYFFSVNTKVKMNDTYYTYSKNNLCNRFLTWTELSKDVDFISDKKFIGNGEEKLAKELSIQNSTFGGQNNTCDLFHHILGKISVKDMSNDDCILGTEGSEIMRKIFKRIVIPFVLWCEKYKGYCSFSNYCFESLQEKKGKSRMSIMKGIDRLELSKPNLQRLNELLEETKEKQNEILPSFMSEYMIDILKEINKKSLQNQLNDCVRNEALQLTLIIVVKEKGWMIVKDLESITCPRITRGSPRIHVQF